MPVFASIGAAVFGAGTFLAGLTAAGLQLAAGIAFNAIGKAMQGEPQSAKFGVQGTLQGGDDVPRSINFGWNCTAGSLVYHNTWGAGGTMSTRVIAIGDLPIRELVGIEVSGVADTLLTATPHPQYGWPVAGFRKAGVDHLWVRFYDGTQTAADPFLVGTVSSPDRPYSASRVGYGVPYVIVTARAPERADGEDKPLFQGLPAYKFITHGVRWYDPSRDDTVGGVGDQRWDDPGTWGGDGDFYPAVKIYNALRGIRYAGQWLYGMQATHPARVDNATFIAAINRCRAITPGTDEPTFRSGGEVQVGAPVNVSIEAWLTACNGRLVEVGGTYKLYVGEPGTPVMAFTDGDIISTEEQSFSPFLSLADTVNGVAASYPNPGEGWNTKTAPTLLRPDLEALDGNRRLLASVSLDMVPYAGQVQRLMKWALAEALRARRHTFVLGPEFRVIEPGDVVRWSSVRNGYVDKLFRVDGVIYRSDLDVIVDLTEVDPSDYDWNQAADYRPVVDGPLQLVGPRPMPMQGWQVFPAMVDNKWPSIEVHAASGVPSAERVHVQVRVGDENGQLIFDSDSQPYSDPWRWILQGQFPPRTLCVVRGVFVGPPNAKWSGWLGVTTGALSIGPTDLTDEVNDARAWATRSIEQHRADTDAMAALLTDALLGGAVDRQTLRTEISARFGEATAAYTHEIDLIAGDLGALGVRTETLEANVNDENTGLVATATAFNQFRVTVNSELEAQSTSITAVEAVIDSSLAGGQFVTEVMATTTGAEATVGLSARATFEGITALPAIKLDARVEGGVLVSDIGLVAARTYIVATDIDGAALEFFQIDGTGVSISNGFIKNLTAENITVDKLDAGQVLQAGSILEDVIAANAITKSFSAQSTNSVALPAANLSDPLVTATTLTLNTSISTGAALIWGLISFTFTATAPRTQVVGAHIYRNGVSMGAFGGVVSVKTSGAPGDINSFATLPIMFNDETPGINPQYTLLAHSLQVDAGKVTADQRRLTVLNTKR